MGESINTVSARSSNVSRQLASFDSLGKTQEDVADSAGRISSGKKSSKYMSEELADKTRQILNTEQNLKQSEELKNKASNISGRIDLAYAVNDRLIEITTEVRERVMKALDSTMKDPNFSSFCKNKIDELQKLLNKQDFEGRTLFGGTATRSDAVDLSLAPVPGAGTIPDPTYNQYFLGEDGIHQASFKGGRVLKYGESAKSQGVRDLVFCLKMGSVTTPDGTDGSVNTQRLKSMHQGLVGTMSGLATSKDALGRQANELESIQNSNEDDLQFLSTTMSELTDADLFKEFIRSSQEMMKLNLNQIMMNKENQSLQNLLSNI